MLIRNWDKHVPMENALISCANDKDLEQPVHLQSIYMANLNFLHFITCEISFLFK